MKKMKFVDKRFIDAIGTLDKDENGDYFLSIMNENDLVEVYYLNSILENMCGEMIRLSTIVD